MVARRSVSMFRYSTEDLKHRNEGPKTSDLPPGGYRSTYVSRTYHMSYVYADNPISLSRPGTTYWARSFVTLPRSEGPRIFVIRYSLFDVQSVEPILDPSRRPRTYGTELFVPQRIGYSTYIYSTTGIWNTDCD